MTFIVLHPKKVSGRFFGQILADVAGPDPSSLPPVGVPVGAVRATGATPLPAADGLPAIADLAGAGADHLIGAERKVPALDEEAPGEDHQAPEVIFVEGADVSDQAAVEAH